jgi:signal transduction histidine kinase
MRGCILCAVWLILAFAPSSAAQPAPRRVLILYSFDTGFASDAAVASAFRTELTKQSFEPVTFFEVSVQPTPSEEAIQEDAVATYLRASLGGRRLDLIVTMSAPAALFVRRHREQLFRETPVLLASVEQRWLQHEVLSSHEAAVPVAVDLVRTVEDILRLRPQTTDLFVVIGDSPLERSWRDQVGRDLQPLAGRLKLVWFNQLSFAEMLKRSAALPENSAILYLVLSVDAKGFSHAQDRVLAELHAAANAPMFSVFGNELGSGVVGGPLLLLDDVASATAASAVRLLRGESPATVKTPPLVAGRSTYDWRELQRWGISEARLPAQSIVLFRQPGVWNQYKSYIVATALILALQTALLAGLIVQRVRRLRTELALRDSERRFRVAAERNQDLAGRLIHAQEDERSRIARDLHDDVSQQLAGLGIMLSSLKRKMTRPGMQSDVDDTVMALQDRTSTLAGAIRNVSHKLHPGTLEHAGLVSTLRQHCAEIEHHHVIPVQFSARGNLESLDLDVALCLYRVTQEALTNALRHASPRKLLVELTATDHIELRVVDDGVGFVPDERAGSGLGLRSIDERVRLAHGHVRIESQPGQGTVLMVHVPFVAKRPGVPLQV